jgi:hypothetical protein
MMIVRPVIIEPLEAEWAEALARMTALVENAPKATREKLLRGAELAKSTRALAEAEAIHEAFIERLAKLRVLDPACGSGNFLYVALRALKDIEHRANLDAEALGLHRGFPRVGPECVLGIEINPYAAELARVSVWIGEIQWMRRNGFDAARNPILRPLDTIECRDAVLDLRDGDEPSTSSVSSPPQDERRGVALTQTAHPEEGLSSPHSGRIEGPSRRSPTRAEWPEAEVIIGNPPFLGNKKMIRELGEGYTLALRQAWPEVPGGVDLVCYWFAKAWAMIVSGRAQRAGFVATQAIRRGTNRKVLRPVTDAGRIFDAWSDQEWTVEGADVRVSLICFERDGGRAARLDGQSVETIGADLKADAAPDQPEALPENKNVAGQGTISGGPFELAPDIARKMLVAPNNPNGESNSAVLRPWRNGDDVTDRPADWWIIDFGPSRDVNEAALYEQPFAALEEAWTAEQQSRREKGEKPLRDGEPKTAARWWILQRRRNGLLSALANQSRYLATPRVSKHRFFVWLEPQIIPDTRLVAFRREDDTFAGVLHSQFHELWSLRLGRQTRRRERPRICPYCDLRHLPLPRRSDPGHSRCRLCGRPARTKNRGRRSAAERIAPELAQPARSRLTRTGSRARLSRPHPAEGRRSGEGAEKAHPHQPLQRAPAMAGERSRRAR